MSCNIQKKTLDHFKKKGLIGDNRLVPTEKIDDFQAENKRLTKYAKDTKNVDLGPLFDLKMTTIEREGNQGTLFKNRAIPNTKAFEAIEKFNDNKSNIFDKKLEILNDSKPEVQSFVFNGKNKSKFDPDKGVEVIQDTADIKNILFGGEFNNMTSNEFLRNLMSHPEVDLSDDYKAVIKKLLPTRSKILIVSEEELDKESKTDSYAVANYNPVTRYIKVNPKRLTEGNLQYAIEVILHEIVHDMTLRSFLGPKNDAQRQFREDIMKAFRYYRSRSNADGYGFTQEAEFIAEIMTNSTFREELKNIDDKQGSLFNRIINAIKRILGFSTDYPNVTDITRSIVEIYDQQSKDLTSLPPLTGDMVFEKSKKNTPSKDLKSKLTDVKSVINKILSSIEAVKKKSISSKGYDKKTQAKYDKIQKLLDKLQKEESKKAILEYLTFAESELDSLIFGLEQSLEANTLTNDYINRSRQYASVFNYVDDITKIVSRMKQLNQISKDEYKTIADSLDKVNGRYNRYTKDSSNLSKDLLAEKFASYNTAPITRAKTKYKSEYRKNKPANKTLDQYVQEKLDQNIESITQQQYDEVREQLEIIPKDISGFHYMLDNEKSIPSLLIHLSSLAFDKADAEIRTSAINLRNTLVNATNDYNPSGNTNASRYKKLLTRDKGGNYYLISEYKAEFVEEFNKVKNDIKDALEEFGENSDEHIAARNKYKKWKAENVVRVTGELNGIPGVLLKERPIKKWLNPKYKELNDKDKKFLRELEESALRANEDTKSINSIVKQPLFGKDSFRIIKLPSIRRSDMDMLLSGNIKRLAKDKIGDLGKKREDDTEYGTLSKQDVEDSIKVMSSMDGETRNTLPVHYRAPIKPEDQSLDLPTIFLLNEAMAVNFRVKSKLESDMVMLQEVVGEADVKQYDTISGIKKIPAFFGFKSKEQDTIIAPGDESNVYKKLKSMIENRLYGITEVSASKIGKLDPNAISNTISSYTADLTLGLNYLSAIPNLTQAKVQNFIEGVGLGTYTRADLRFAEKEYWSQMQKGGLNDIGALKNKNKINLLIEHFDLMGDFNVVKNLIEDDTKLRALMKKGTMHSLNSMSEHYAQSTLMLAILNSVKIKNSKGQYINKEGKVVSKEEAMTMYEAFDVKVDKKTDTTTLSFNNKAKKSSFSESNFNDLGMIQHQNLIKKKVIDLHGQYDTNLQSHIQRHWYGKLLFMFRKWMLSSYKRRFRGIAHRTKHWNSLTEEQRQYDYSLQEYDEGIYTSFLRFMKFGVIDSIKNLNMEILTSNWEQLTDKERSNIYKTTREIAMIGVMYAGYMLSTALAEDDEDNEELYYLLAFNFRRQVSELGQYGNPLELMRTMKSPFAAMNTLEKTGKLLYQLVGDPTEEYKTGERKGELKSWIKFKKLVPYVAQTERSAEQSLNFLKTLSN